MGCRAAAFLVLFSLGAFGCGDADVPAPGAPASRHPACVSYAFDDAAAENAGVRAFVVQNRTAPEHLPSYDTFRAQLVGLVDARVRPCLAPDRPNLIVFAEDVGLPAIFIGSRGEKAREATNVEAAILSLPGAYAQPIAHYKGVFPDMSFGQTLFVGATDTLWRAFGEVMHEIATTTGAYVVASANVSGRIEKSADPGELVALRDPDLPEADYVWVAREPEVYNTAFVFDPSGEVIARARKPYLVEVEEGALGLAYGDLAEVVPIDLAGVARLGILTSKDAWMPDVVGRLAAQGANVFVQPEAFSGWTIAETDDPDEWLPDVFRQSGWAATQKHGAFRYALIPHITGNLVTAVFDGQSAIVADSIPGQVAPAYVGQPPEGGFLQVAPWAEPDPGVTDPSLSLADRRAMLREAGEARLPGAPLAGHYVETVLGADLATQGAYPVIEDGPPGALGPSHAVTEPAGAAPELGSEQVAPAITGDGDGKLWVAYVESGRVRVARADDGGARFRAPVEPADTQGPAFAPAIAWSAPALWVAWEEPNAGGGTRIMVARSDDGGSTFGPVVEPAPRQAATDRHRPVLATDGSSVWLAFVDRIDGQERIVVALSVDGTAWSVAAADAAPMPHPPPNIRNNQWAPALAAHRGAVAVGWVDFRNYSWDVFVSRSSDGGASFGAAERIDDGTDARERVHDDPSLLFSVDGALVVGWTDVRFRMTPARPRVRRETMTGVALGELPDFAQGWRPQLARIGERIVVVWQDHRDRGNDVYLATSSDGGAAFSAARRVDDGGDGPSYQLAPVVADAGRGRVAVVWEDTRSGRRRLRIAVGAP